MGVPPRGNHVRIELAAFYLFDEKIEKLIAERMYYDQATVFKQVQAGAAGAVG
jgi:predicted ester cyclase